MRGAYYNEHDPFAAAWLRELIKAGLIADGEVDERDIQTVTADDVQGFVQCHWFAGIGGWSYALRLAGWPDDRPAWTGSCPCQPFSSAGAQAGGHDPRDLWPAWQQLIAECRPPVVFGEQVAAAVAHHWFDRVADDLEGHGYAVGAACLPAASVGAFHLRNRLWFVADRTSLGQSGWGVGDGGVAPCDGSATAIRRDGGEQVTELRPAGLVAESERGGREGTRLHVSERGPQQAVPGIAGTSADECVADPERRGQRIDRSAPWDAGYPDECGASQLGHADGERRINDHEAGSGSCSVVGEEARQDSGAGIWHDVLWLPCRDGKSRPAQSSIQPLASGILNRVGLLRGAGNSIVPQVAQAFIEAYLELEF